MPRPRQGRTRGRSYKQDLVRIEQMLTDMQGNIQQALDRMNDFDRVLTELDDIKQQVNRPRRRRRRSRSSADSDSQNPLSGLQGNGGDLSGIMDLLQNPQVQSMLQSMLKNFNSGGGSGSLPGGSSDSLPANPGGSSPLKNLDLNQIMSLMQNPLVQNMIRRFM